MSIPQFTAQVSLYKTSNLYRSSGFEGGDLRAGESIMPAYHPGPVGKAACERCVNSAISDYFYCIATKGFPVSLISCTLGAWWDGASCVVDDCCPKRCGPPDFGDLAGSGCCDADETCVSKDDPYSRTGCCPRDQKVCAGKCCAKGASCCGDTCCAAGYFCRDGMFCEREFIGTFPDTRPPPPPPPFNPCIFGGEYCGGKCCDPDLRCCYPGTGQPYCARDCIH
jgi:hypothetical protein